MSARNRMNLSIDQGSDFSRTVKLKRRDGTPIDIQMDTFEGEIKTSYSDAIAVANFVFTVIDGINGTIGFSLDDAVTSAFSPDITYIYNIHRVSVGKRTKLVWGSIGIRPQV